MIHNNGKWFAPWRRKRVIDLLNQFGIEVKQGKGAFVHAHMGNSAEPPLIPVHDLLSKIYELHLCDRSANRLSVTIGFMDKVSTIYFSLDKKMSEEDIQSEVRSAMTRGGMISDDRSDWATDVFDSWVTTLGPVDAVSEASVLMGLFIYFAHYRVKGSSRSEVPIPEPSSWETADRMMTYMTTHVMDWIAVVDQDRINQLVDLLEEDVPFQWINSMLISD